MLTRRLRHATHLLHPAEGHASHSKLAVRGRHRWEACFDSSPSCLGARPYSSKSSASGPARRASVSAFQPVQTEAAVVGKPGSRRSLARYATPVASSSDGDNALFDLMFAPFGVSPMQFRTLIASGERVKVTKDVLIVPGGELNTKVLLILRGWAVAYKHGQPKKGETTSVSDPEEVMRSAAGSSQHAEASSRELEPGEPVCQYVGKLDDVGEDIQLIKGVVLPTRASVIGGSALVDKDVATHLYPNDVIAATNMEYLQWEVEDLMRVMDAPKWRAVQASIYYSLYVDLIGTLDRDRAVALMTKDKPASKKAPAREVTPPTGKQLRSLAIFVAVPFFGFGFADNCIMLVCGDFIDATFGTVLGLSTLAAAGLGNWVSDAVGLGLGDAIEQSAVKMGLTNGNLKPAQEKLPIARFTTTFSKLIGISLGCLAGMCPLIWMTPAKKEFTKEDIQLYDSLFAPNGVSTSDFERLMEKSTRRKFPPLSQIVEGGQPMTKVMLVLRGEALAYPTHSDSSRAMYPTNAIQEHGRPTHKFVGRFSDDDDSAPSADADDPWVSIHGSMIGGSALADQGAKKSSPYPSDIWSSTAVELIEWELDDVLEVTRDPNPIQASFYSMLYVALVKNLQKDRPVKQLEVYRAVLKAVLADGYLDSKECEYIQQTRQALNISDHDHFEVLADIGWTRQRWESNLTSSKTRPPPERNFMECIAKVEEEIQNLRLMVRSQADAMQAGGAA